MHDLNVLGRIHTHASSASYARFYDTTLVGNVRFIQAPMCIPKGPYISVQTPIFSRAWGVPYDYDMPRLLCTKNSVILPGGDHLHDNAANTGSR